MTIRIKHRLYNLQVGDDGSVVGPSGRVLKPRLTNCGYLSVAVYICGKQKALTIHRLVAECFVPGRADTVNHKDGNKKNNCAENLEWCSRSENSRHAIRMGLFVPKRPSAEWIAKAQERGTARAASGVHKGINNGMAKLTEDQVREIRVAPEAKYGESPWKTYGISSVMYRNIKTYKSWSHIS